MPNKKNPRAGHAKEAKRPAERNWPGKAARKGLKNGDEKVSYLRKNKRKKGDKH